MNTTFERLCEVPGCKRPVADKWEGCRGHMELFWDERAEADEYIGWPRFVHKVSAEEMDPLTLIWPTMR